MIVHWIRSGWLSLLDLFFPNGCITCIEPLESNESIICTTCRLKLPETNLHLPDEPQILIQRFAGQVSVEFVYSYLYFQKRSLVQKLIHALKYKGRKDVGQQLGQWYGRLLKDETSLKERFDAIISVPLHPAKLQKRGYNQSDCFAEGLSDVLELPCLSNCLIRVKFTESQTNKDRAERWANVKSVFAVKNKALLIDKRIVLVDDVLTTGATLEACTEALLNAGCRSVGILTIAAAR